MSKCFCVHCGEKQEELRPAYSTHQKLASCANCGKEPVTIYTLLINLNLLELTACVCPHCQYLNYDGEWCFNCGSRLN